MKCDELKAYEICGEENGELHFATVYPKSKVDAAIAELKEVLAELKEAQRWRKFSEEKPKSDNQYLVYDMTTRKYGKSFYSCTLGAFQFPVTHWMPLPKEPEET